MIADNPLYNIPYLLTHGVDEEGFEFFKSAQRAMEVRYNEDGSCDIYIYSADQDPVCEYKGLRLPIEVWPNHKVFFLERTDHGRHRLGGNRPAEFNLPICDMMKTPFHYIGAIDSGDAPFEWLGIPALHIVYPINECNSGIFLDYSDPLSPKVLNPETFLDAWHEHMEVQETELVFSERQYRSVNALPDEFDSESDATQLCGVPMWFQFPEPPRCPTSGEVMRFVCMINSSHEMVSSNGKDYLCFGDYGHLYVFFEPRARILHVNVQY